MVYKAEIIPTLWMAQSAEIGPEDARTFHDLVYRSASILALIQRYSFMGGIAALALGVGLLLLSCFLARRRQQQEERMIGEEEEERREADMEAGDQNGTLDRGLDTEHGCVCFHGSIELTALKRFFIAFKFLFFLS